MATSHFANMPNINMPRTMFPFKVGVKGSINFGTLNVIDCIPILPGDTFSGDYSSLIRMSTPISPIMDNIKMYVHAFFVPLRLLWSHTEEFYGENKLSAGPANLSQYQKPHISLYTNGVPVGSVSHQLGKPYCTADNSKTSYGIVNVLKERGYYLIWSEWFRPQQVQAPVILDTGDTGAIGTLDGVALTTASMPLPVAKKMDYFTSQTLSPVYAAAEVSLPLGTAAPVYPMATPHGFGTVELDWRYTNGNFVNGKVYPVVYGNGSGDAGTYAATSSDTLGSSLKPSNLYADLTRATAATISSLKYALAVEKWLERSNFGSRFFEMLQVHYGITSPDARLQRPEYLGGLDFYINIDQVLQTTGYASGSSSELGIPGANSTTAAHNKGFFSKAFVEPGFLYFLCCTKQDQTYSQGILCEDAKLDLFDEYFPEFDALSDKMTLRQEVMMTGTSSDLLPFGAQEHWAEYKYRPQRVYGILDPNVPSALDYWTLANKFANQPSLDSTFIFENRNNIQRALVTGSSGPDFICDWLIDCKAVRPMHAYPEYLRTLDLL